MGGLELTRAERAAGLKELPGGDQQPFMPWHDPETGKDLPRLPSDTPNAMNYMLRGLRMGEAPPELKAKWKAGEADRKAAADKRDAELRAGEHGKAIRDAENSGKEPAVSPKMVEDAVRKVLREAGIIPPADEAPQEEETKQDEEPAEPEQGQAPTAPPD